MQFGRRGLRLGRSHREDARQIALDLVGPDPAHAHRRRSGRPCRRSSRPSRPKSPVSEARRAVSSAAGIGSAPSRRISARIRPSTSAAASLRVCVVATNGPGSRRASTPLPDAVGKAAADADLLVEPRAVAAAEHRIGDERAIDSADRCRASALRATATAAWPAPGMSMTMMLGARRRGRGRPRSAAAIGGPRQLPKWRSASARAAPASMSPDEDQGGVGRPPRLAIGAPAMSARVIARSEAAVPPAGWP